MDLLRRCQAAGRRLAAASRSGALVMLAAVSMPPQARAEEPATLLVLDYEFDGDPGDPTLLAERRRRMERMTQVLRDAMRGEGQYRVVDSPQVRADIARAKAAQYLHRCNGCELDLARTAGARYVMIPWVFRMSQLVVTMHFEIKDVSTGALVMKRALDFRNDTDASWAREIEYLVRDLREGKRWN